MASRTMTFFLLGVSIAAGPLAGFAQQAPAATPPVANVQGDGQQVDLGASSTPAATSGEVSFTVPAGTKIPLSLRSPLSTKTAKPGDAVYLTTSFPVVVASRVVIPAGVFVQGYVDGLQRPGKVKGRAQLMMHFVSIVFPNGVVIALPGAVDKVPGAPGAQVKDKEGLIQQSSTKGRDAATVGTAAATGAGLGALAGYAGGSAGMGVGIGAGAGAAVGIIQTMFKHANDDIVFPEGSTIVMVMQRPLEVREQQLGGMQQLTGYNGPAMSPVDAQQVMMPKPKSQLAEQLPNK